MGTYWANFLNEYGVYLHSRTLPLSKILEAFWEYCQIKDPKRKVYCEAVLYKGDK